MNVACYADLFGEPPLSGFRQSEGFISPEEERALIQNINQAGLEPFRFQQWTGKRLTRSYGWTYDFQTGCFTLADPIPTWLSSLKLRAARFADLDAADLVQALVIHYDHGAGIGWHRDRPMFEHVIGVSLGAPTTMRFRQREGAKFRRVTMPLHPRAIYHMSGEARHMWEHSIVEMDAPRWSITFRSLSR